MCNRSCGWLEAGRTPTLENDFKDKFSDAFSYILIICSLHLHKFSYNSQIHNVLTCVNTLHFSEWDFFIYFFYNDLHDSEVWLYDTLCITPVLESVLPET